MTVIRKKGLFVVFEGIDGSGKSTQAKLLADKLESERYDALLTAEPSDGPMGLVIRSLTDRLALEDEVRLFTEDRRDHVERVIIPALKSRKIVICDRYIFSSAAYQGARGIDPQAIVEANLSFAPLPDVVFLLDLPVEKAVERISQLRGGWFSPFEVARNLQEVRRIYRSLQDASTVLVEADQSVREIEGKILAHVRSLLYMLDVNKKF